MPLNPIRLQSELFKLTLNPPSSADEAAQRCAAAYGSYALETVVPGALFIGAEARMKAVLMTVLANPRGGSPQALAHAWAVGVGSFWMGPPPVFATGVVSFPGLFALEQALTSILMMRSNTADNAASLIATALDAATRTVTVTMGPITVLLT